MNAVERSVLNTIQRAAGKRAESSRRYRVRVGAVDVIVRASGENEAKDKAASWHRRHANGLGRDGLKHTNPAAAVMSLR